MHIPCLKNFILMGLGFFLSQCTAKELASLDALSNKNNLAPPNAVSAGSSSAGTGQNSPLVPLNPANTGTQNLAPIPPNGSPAMPPIPVNGSPAMPPRF